MIVEETLDAVWHGTLQPHSPNRSSRTNAAEIGLGAVLLEANAAEDVPTVGQAERPMRRVVGNHTQRVKAFVAVKKLETVATVSGIA